MAIDNQKAIIVSLYKVVIQIKLHMKTRSVISSMLFAAASLVMLAGCSGGGKHDHGAESGHDHGHEHASGSEAAVEAGNPQFQVDAAFQQQLAGLFNSYIELKNALVDSDPAKAQSVATEVKTSLEKVDMALLSGAAHNDWMNWLMPMQKSVSEISQASDIEEQRKSFSGLSDNMYKSIKAFGLGGEEAFYEYCPMAFNNEGAYWLSDNSEIRNPYFGDKMLKCGVVKEKLR